MIVGSLRSLGCSNASQDLKPSPLEVTLLSRSPADTQGLGQKTSQYHYIISAVEYAIYHSCCRHKDPACSCLNLHFPGWIWGPSPPPSVPSSLPASKSWGESRTSHLPSPMATTVCLMPVGSHSLRWLPSQRKRIREGLEKRRGSEVTRLCDKVLRIQHQPDQLVAADPRQEAMGPAAP